MFVVGFVTSSMMKFVNRKMGHKATFLLGCVLGKVLRLCYINLTSFESNKNIMSLCKFLPSLGCASSTWVFFGCKTDSDFIHYEVYAVGALIGAGGSTMLITRQTTKRILIITYVIVTRSGPKIPAADQLKGEASFGFWDA